jgi:hypothetical protein
MRVNRFRSQSPAPANLKTLSHINIRNHAIGTDGGRTFLFSVFKCRHVPLNRVECVPSAFYVFEIGVPFCGFGCEARVVEDLGGHFV